MNRSPNTNRLKTIFSSSTPGLRDRPKLNTLLVLVVVALVAVSGGLLVFRSKASNGLTDLASCDKTNSSFWRCADGLDS